MRRIAAEVEDRGYSTLWTNDTPMPGADGLATAQVIADASSALGIGIGVLAVDRLPVAQWAERLLELPNSRLVVGIGAGMSERPVQVVTEAVAELREAQPTVRIAVAAMGPRMIRTAGAVADVVLLNWMTPSRIDWALQRLTGSPAKVAAYVRAASGPGARELIAAEADRYCALPHYRRHFEAMGAEPHEVGVVLGEDSIEPYESRLDEVVVRGIASDAGDASPLLDLVRLGAPGTAI